MRVNSKHIIAAISAVLILAGASAFAARGHGEHSERMLDKVSERLELDDGQQVALQALHAEFKLMRESVRGEQGSTMTQLQELMTQDSFDQTAALAMIEQRTEAVRSSAPELVNAAAVFFDGLSDEQKADVAGFIEKRGSRHHH